MPRLRTIGFTGSGKHYRRVIEEVLNGVTIWGDKYGGQCSVDLGIHLTFLPDHINSKIKPSQFKEIDSDIRWRLMPPGHRGDWKWNYAEGRASVDALVEAFFEWGEPVFSRFRTLESIVNALSLEDLRADSLGSLPTTHLTQTRAAMMYARIHEHLGNVALAREFGKLGLETMGRGILLKPELERLSNL